MSISIYCDSGDLAQIKRYADDPRIKGFTTNPSLIRKFVRLHNYRQFAKAATSAVNDKVISLEVIADEWETMEAQARELAALGPNVYVKIPITNTKGESSRPLIEKLADLNLNVTAVMTREQVDHVVPVMRAHHILSIFNGRITDTQRYAMCFWKHTRPIMHLLWASARHIGCVKEAEGGNFDIITLSPELIEKLPLAGKDLTQYSLETVAQFYRDGQGIEW